MISVIVSSIQDPSWTLHERNVAKTVAAPCEYLRIDNRGTARGLCSVYNAGVAKATGDIVAFVHEDAFFMAPGWGEALERKFAGDERLGMVGVAGTRYLCGDRMAWTFAGRPYLRGRVVHELDNGADFSMAVFSWDKNDADVVAVDGLFLAIRRSLFDRIRFDERTFDAFHFYDLDISMQVRRTHRIIVTWDVAVQHRSAGRADDGWRLYGRRFLDKYRRELPVSCAETVPDFSQRRQPGMNYDLRGKMSPAIIC